MRRKRYSKLAALIMSAVMLLGSSVTAFAATGTIVNGFTAVRTGGTPAYGGTWICQVNDGQKTLIDACCCEQTNGSHPENGDKAEVIPLTDKKDIRVRMAYVCYKHWDKSDRDVLYSLSRACSIATKVTTYGGAGYDNRKQVESFYDEAVSLKKAPDNFNAYLIKPYDGSQKQLGWRINPEGKARVKRIPSESSELVKLCPERYSLKGAVFYIYDTYEHAKAYENKGYINKGSLVTDSNGMTEAVTLDEGTYYMVEGTAPINYKLDREPVKFTVKSGSVTTVEFSDKPLFDPFSMKIQKQAEETADKSLSLEGAEYTVKYYKEYLNVEQVKSAEPFRTWVFRTDKNGYIELNADYKVGGDDLFIDENDDTVGLMGTYTVEETKAPKGFLREKGIISLQHASAEKKLSGVSVLKDVTHVEKTQKVNIELYKKDAETGESRPQGFGSLAGAVYDVLRCDSDESGEVKAGQITTDEKGYGIIKGLEAGLYKIREVAASAGYLLEEAVHTIEGKVKDPDTAVFTYSATSKEKPTTVEIEKTGLKEKGALEHPKGAVLQLLDDGDKVMESWTTDGTPHRIKGLTAGRTYRIREVKAPEGYHGLDEDFTFTVKATDKVQKHEIFNEPVPEISTKALFETNVSSSLPEADVKVTDTVSYKKLLKGKSYTVKGKLVDATDPSRVISEGMTTFTPETSDGNVKVTYSFDGTDLEGTVMVATEKLYINERGRERLVASHENLMDKDQTVSVIELKTDASDGKDGAKDMFPGESEKIVDKVSYKGLIEGHEYTVKGKLMDKASGKPVLLDGKEITAEKTFKAQNSDGIIELEFVFDGRALKGKTVVVFEEMYEEDIKVAVHADLEDRGQTVFIPEIRTEAVSKDDLTKSVLPLKEVTVADKVKYSNLMSGEKYIMESQLINKATGKVISSGYSIFIAEEADGEISMEMKVDTCNLAGSYIVAFETLYRSDEEGNKVKKVAEHNNPDDKGQTVKVEKPEVGTSATFKDGSKASIAGKKMTVRDKVSYSGLIGGKEYTLKGRLMDKSTGKVLTAGGREVVTEKKFTAEGQTGTVDMTFEFDGSELGERDLVVFEELYYDNQLICSHEDMENKEQTVKLKKQPEPVPTGDGSNMALLMMTMAMSTSAALYVRSRKTGIR